MHHSLPSYCRWWPCNLLQTQQFPNKETRCTREALAQKKLLCVITFCLHNGNLWVLFSIWPLYLIASCQKVLVDVAQHIVHWTRQHSTMANCLVYMVGIVPSNYPFVQTTGMVLSLLGNCHQMHRHPFTHTHACIHTHSMHTRSQQSMHNAHSHITYTPKHTHTQHTHTQTHT